MASFQQDIDELKRKVMVTGVTGDGSGKLPVTFETGHLFRCRFQPQFG